MPCSIAHNRRTVRVWGTVRTPCAVTKKNSGRVDFIFGLAFHTGRARVCRVRHLGNSTVIFMELAVPSFNNPLLSWKKHLREE